MNTSSSSLMSAAHTAEHIFMGTLIRLKPEVEVKRVELSEDRNCIFFKSPPLELDIIFEAERLTNEVIERCLQVKEHYFDSLEEAKMAFPSLRAMEERISGRVRVVEVDGYDYAACNKAHISDSGECEFFLVTALSKADREIYELQFEVGLRAKLKALEFARICMEVCETLGATLKTVEKAAENLVGEVKDLRRRLVAFSEREVDELPFTEIRGLKVYSKIFEGLDRRRLVEKLGGLIKKDKTVVVVGDADIDGFIIFGRSSDLKFNCNELLKDALQKFGGKGGGKPEFSFGSVDRDRVKDAVDYITKSIYSSL